MSLPRRQLPPRRPRQLQPQRPKSLGYSETTSFALSPELREDVERLRIHFKCATAGELFRTLIRVQIDHLERPGP